MSGLANKTTAPVLGIIGGTGISQLDGFVLRDKIKPDTPFGDISGAVLLGQLHGREVALINRHGLLADGASKQHIPPHQINYRANLWALKQLQVTAVLGLNAVGGISAQWPPGRLGTPHDVIDYSWGREHTFFDVTSPMPFATHVELTPPFDATLRQQLQAAAELAEITLTQQGVVAVTNGPRLETVAEVQRLAQDGCELVGMTSMPEAALAAELELAYASLCFSVNWAAGKAPSSSGGIHAEIEATIADCQQQINALLASLLVAL